MGKNDLQHINDTMNEHIAAAHSIVTPSEAASGLGLQEDEVYIQADAYLGKPSALLGTVIEIVKTSDKLPTESNLGVGKMQISAFKIAGAKPDESANIKEPVKRQSIIVDKQLAAGVKFLNYLSGEFKGQETFSLIVFDQMTGLVDRDDDSWQQGVDKWVERNKALLEDPNVL